jgi:hypothetical protein
MKIDAFGLLHRAAETHDRNGDGATAYVLYEFANNLRLLMRGEVTIDEWNAVYVGQDRDAVDIDRVLPAPNDA